MTEGEMNVTGRRWAGRKWKGGEEGGGGFTI